jgi:replication factor C subunit 3/5
MFLVDKYYNESNTNSCNQQILDRILDQCNSHKYIYDNFNEISKSKDKLIDSINFIINNPFKFENLQHLILYGLNGCGKEFLVNKLVESIYGVKGSKTKEVEYIINGYGNTKTKVLIKQSNNHIVIEPNNNGFDKYLIQEIIQEYAKTEILDICYNMNKFKIVIIDKIDNLNYYAQTSLRRTMEKYSKSCKFIFISNQLSKIIEPLKSRCLSIRVPLPTDAEIINVVLKISIKENINITFKDIQIILKNCDSNINKAIWYLEYKKLGLENKNNNWENLIDEISILLTNKIKKNSDINNIIVKCRKIFYILYITNIDLNLVISKLMEKLIELVDDNRVKYEIISLTSQYQFRMINGTRQIIHLEAYILNIVKIIYEFTLK